MRTANYTDLRTNLKGYIDSVIDDCETVIVNRGNGSGVVLISLDEYNSLKETEYIMSSPQTMEDIRQRFGKSSIEIASLTEDIKIRKDKTEVKVLPSTLRK